LWGCLSSRLCSVMFRMMVSLVVVSLSFYVLLMGSMMLILLFMIYVSCSIVLDCAKVDVCIVLGILRCISVSSVSLSSVDDSLVSSLVISIGNRL